MKKFKFGFGCGIGLTLFTFVTILAIWFSLNDETRSTIFYILTGITGMVIGGAFALALVSILLLRQISWKVDRSPAPTPPVVIMGGEGQPLLQAPDQQYEPPPRWRGQRNFRVLGGQGDDGHDTVDGDYRQVPPGTW